MPLDNQNAARPKPARPRRPRGGGLQPQRPQRPQRPSASIGTAGPAGPAPQDSTAPALGAFRKWRDQQGAQANLGQPGGNMAPQPQPPQWGGLDLREQLGGQPMPSRPAPALGGQPGFGAPAAPPAVPPIAPPLTFGGGMVGGNMAQPKPQPAPVLSPRQQRPQGRGFLNNGGMGGGFDF